MHRERTLSIHVVLFYLCKTPFGSSCLSLPSWAWGSWAANGVLAWAREGTLRRVLPESALSRRSVRRVPQGWAKERVFQRPNFAQGVLEGAVLERPGSVQERSGAPRGRPAAVGERPGSVQERSGSGRGAPCREKRGWNLRLFFGPSNWRGATVAGSSETYGRGNVFQVF